ncbi:MAG TPA: hypothetical protein VEH54_07870 [Steroidobacteraceae bacterium]|nr:hypothetical protein [Steroidobacteraceae bacterium]
MADMPMARGAIAKIGRAMAAIATATVTTATATARAAGVQSTPAIVARNAAR